MFHLGLFSSFMPYIVIAALYLFGLASYSYGLFGSQTEDNNTGEITIKKQYNLSSEKDGNRETFFFETFSFFEDNTNNKAVKPPVAKNLFNRYEYIRSHFDSEHFSSIYSRPPPSL